MCTSIGGSRRLFVQYAQINVSNHHNGGLRLLLVYSFYARLVLAVSWPHANFLFDGNYTNIACCKIKDAMLLSSLSTPGYFICLIPNFDAIPSYISSCCVTFSLFTNFLTSIRNTSEYYPSKLVSNHVYVRLLICKHCDIIHYTK